MSEAEPKDGTAWTIDNKCYNGQLYSCQCLELGIIMRYLRYTDPTVDISLNGVYLPPCLSEPECSPNPTVCPYLLDPESTALCSLFYQLVTLQSEANHTTVGIQEVTCPYMDNPTSASLLCELWCQVEEFSGSFCLDSPTSPQSSSTPSTISTSVSCPYDSYTNNYVLCQLWRNIQVSLDAAKSTTALVNLSTIPASGTVPAITEPIQQIPYNSCPYMNLTDGALACQMWCSLQELSHNGLCSDSTSCPYENYTIPHDTSLCILWAENINLKFLLFGINTTSTISVAPTQMIPLFGLSSGASNIVACIYDGYPFMLDYCSLWCENQMFKYGIICSDTTSTSLTSSSSEESTSSTGISTTPSLEPTISSSINEPLCSYESFVEAVLLCQLYNSIEAAKLYSSSTTSSSTISSSLTTSLPPDGFYTGTFNETECPYLELTNGTLICSLWCELLGLSTGLSCGYVTPIITVSNEIYLIKLTLFRLGGGRGNMTPTYSFFLHNSLSIDPR